MTSWSASEESDLFPPWTSLKDTSRSLVLNAKPKTAPPVATASTGSRNIPMSHEHSPPHPLTVCSGLSGRCCHPLRHLVRLSLPSPGGPE
ncbi:hypothetical protein PDJAM_G00081670 [Pangasius djambal]|uniref:Uncharacterized protein n=1 Tax=Pangasius djambal TaxID=1691987 RepID=A0ACC5Z3E9_9TELE|nr:hypothetical protein [Pangasius djambal]